MHRIDNSWRLNFSRPWRGKEVQIKDAGTDLWRKRASASFRPEDGGA